MLNSVIDVERSQNKIMQSAIIIWKCNDREFKYRKTIYWWSFGEDAIPGIWNRLNGLMAFGVRISWDVRTCKQARCRATCRTGVEHPKISPGAGRDAYTRTQYILNVDPHAWRAWKNAYIIIRNFVNTPRVVRGLDYGIPLVHSLRVAQETYRLP